MYLVTEGWCLDPLNRTGVVHFFGETFADFECEQGKEADKVMTMQCVMGSTTGEVRWNDTVTPECRGEKNDLRFYYNSQFYSHE